MGYIRHHAIVVTGMNREHAEKARALAVEVFNEVERKYVGDVRQYGRLESLISEIVESTANDYYSFFIAPDGSKEGWNHSDIMDIARSDFLRFLTHQYEDGEIYASFIEIEFGGDGPDSKIMWDSVIRKG